jgi:hypothetical protein
MRSFAAVMLIATLAGLGIVHADQWDAATKSDDGMASDNELTHGLSQLHDLGVRPGSLADVDYYPVTLDPWTSFEVVVDGLTGDLGLGASSVVRLDENGAVLQTSAPAGSLGRVRSLAWIQQGGRPALNFVRVGGAQCGANCGSDDVYRLRAYETTYAVPRFNNSGTQTTVLLLQNNDRNAVSGDLVFRSPNGAIIATVAFTIPVNGLLVYHTAQAAPNTAGSISIPNTARYGSLAGKSIAMEPSTGFAFDTAGVYKPH